MKTPEITVLMPVYNGQKYLQEAIESILNQSFSHLEFLIINDASTDKTKSIIESYADPRIKLINNKTNMGTTRSLNKGLTLARGKYVARMDADDISHPERLKIQFGFLEQHPEVGAVGTWARVVGKGRKKYIKTYTDPEKIKAILLFKNAVVHPSVMMRHDFFKKYALRYDENLRFSQDYELWTRAVQYFPVSNIKQYLLSYRAHDENVSKQHTTDQKKYSSETKIHQLAHLNIVPPDEEKIIHQSTYKPVQYEISNFLQKVERWLLKTITQNNWVEYCREPQFSMVVANRWLYICSINANYRFDIFLQFWKSPLRKKLDWTDWENVKRATLFCAKCLLKNSTTR